MNQKAMKKPAARLKGASLVMLIGTLIILTACNMGAGKATATPTAEPTSEPTPVPGSNEPSRGQAVINGIDVLVMESFPVQVNVVAAGDLPDTCTQIDEVISQLTGDTFRVAITTLRQPDPACAQMVVPFEQSISLDVDGLAAGTYQVSVNGVTGSFTLDTDNTLNNVNPSISGFVWHDLCSQTGTAVNDATEEKGCVPSPDGETVQADGKFQEGEPGIPGVKISLLAGDCTSATEGDEIFATTDESGAYSFEDLTPDTYCVFLDTDDEDNAAILEEGILTSPTSNGVPTNSVTVNLEEGESLAGINFGYDFLFLPVPESAKDCVNSFEYVQDLTVPDNSAFPPNVEFVAGWRLRNNGTCPWTKEYTVSFIGGDAMGATAIPLGKAVSPGQTLDVMATLTSPGTPGTYRSNWQLSDAEGNVFGINGEANDAFWVQIVVDASATFIGTPAPGSAVIGGVLWSDVCFLTNGTPSRGCVETESGSGFYRANGTFDASERPLPGITLILGQGACPEGGIPTPASRLATTVSDEKGLYRFEGLDAGIYCVAVDALSSENVDLLIPGNWTWPAPGTGRQGIRLALGEQRLTVDFGWQHMD